MVSIRRFRGFVFVCFLVAFGSVRCGASESFFFIFCGDSRFGSDSASDHPEILDQIVDEANIRKPAFFLYGGDGPDHNTAENYEAFKARLDRLTMPYYNVVGNHDIYVEATRGYSREHQRLLFGDPYYTFEVEDSYFLVLDSAGHGARPWGVRASSPGQWDWMVQQLKANVPTHRHTFVVSHVPPYDAPPKEHHAFSDTTEAAAFVKLMAQSGVTMVLCSHEHLYYRTEWEGVSYIISGGAGAVLYAPVDQGGFYHYMEIHVKGPKIWERVVPVLASITIYPRVPPVDTLSVVVGEHLRFVARGKDPTGRTFPIESPMDRMWSSSHPQVGTISPFTGVFQTLSAGTTEVRMTSGLKSGTITVRVVGKTQIENPDSQEGRGD